MFGDIAATFKVSSDAAITATAPAAPIGTVDVTVTTPLGTSAIVLADEFNYFAPATVTSLSPSTGPVGTSVVITGTNLFATAAVTFGSVAAAMSIHVTSNSHVTAVAPAGTGTVDVSVTTTIGTTLTSGSDKFTYAPCGDRREPRIRSGDWRDLGDHHRHQLQWGDGCRVRHRFGGARLRL